jgi:metallophosphoesterase superfamily enzyme
MNKENLGLVRELIAEGCGRKRIADALEITEYKARMLMQEVVDQQPTRKPKRQVAATIPFKKETKNAGKKPNISVTRDAVIQPKINYTNKITIRPTSFKVAAISDVHYPFEDSYAIQICKAYLKDYKPDMIVMNGDMVDFYSVSKYEKDPERKLDLQQEIDYSVEKLEEWVYEFPDTEFVYLEGNHEQRLKRFLKSNASALLSMRTLDIEKNLNLKSIGIQWVGSETEYQIGNLLFTHGHKARRHAGTTARGHFEDFGCSVIVGHIHRLAVGYKRNKNGNHVMIENGTLCDLDVEYCKFPDWQHGFCTIDFDGDDFAVNTCAIDDYKLIVGNKVYEL